MKSVQGPESGSSCPHCTQQRLRAQQSWDGSPAAQCFYPHFTGAHRHRRSVTLSWHQWFTWQSEARGRQLMPACPAWLAFPGVSARSLRRPSLPGKALQLLVCLTGDRRSAPNQGAGGSSGLAQLPGATPGCKAQVVSPPPTALI